MKEYNNLEENCVTGDQPYDYESQPYELYSKSEELESDKEVSKYKNKWKQLIIFLSVLIIGIFAIAGFYFQKYIKDQEYQLEIANEYIKNFEADFNDITQELNEILDDKFAQLEKEDVEYFEALGDIIDSYYPFKERLENFKDSVTAESAASFIPDETQKDLLSYIDATIEEVDAGLSKAVDEMKGLYLDILGLYNDDNTLESLAKAIPHIEETIELLESAQWAKEFLSEDDYEELYTDATNMLAEKETSISKLISYTKAGSNGVICYSTTSQEASMLTKVNALREKNGLNTLTYDSGLFSIAKIRGVEITKLFSHTRPNGTDCLTVSDDMGGENISCNSMDFSVSASYTQFYDSIGHRDNMLYEHYTRFACNRVIANGTAYWVQIFGF